MILTGISVACEALLGFNLLTPSRVSFRETSLKLNFGLSISFILFLIEVILECSLYLSNESFTESVKNSTDGSLIDGFAGNDKFLTILQKILLNVSAISSSLDNVTLLSIKFIVSLWFISSEKGVLQVAKTSYYQQFCLFLYSQNIPF